MFWEIFDQKKHVEKVFLVEKIGFLAVWVILRVSFRLAQVFRTIYALVLAQNPFSTQKSGFPRLR